MHVSPSLILAGCRAVAAGSQVATLVLIGRVAGADALGAFGVALSGAFIGALVADVGLSTFLLTNSGRGERPADVLLRAFSPSRATLNIVAIVVTGVAVGALLASPAIAPASALLCFSATFNVWVRSVLQGVTAIKYEAYSSVGVAAVQLAAAVGSAVIVGNLVVIVWSYAVASCIVDAARLTCKRGLASTGRRPTIGRTLPYAGTQVSATAQNRGGVILLQLFGVPLPLIAFYQTASRVYYVAPLLFEADGPVVAAESRSLSGWESIASGRWRGRAPLVVVCCVGVVILSTAFAIASAVPLPVGSAFWSLVGAAFGARGLSYIPSITLQLKARQIEVFKISLASTIVNFSTAGILLAFGQSLVAVGMGLCAGELVLAALLTRTAHYPLWVLAITVCVGGLLGGLTGSTFMKLI